MHSLHYCETLLFSKAEEGKHDSMSKVHTAFGLVIASGHHLKIILRRVLTTSISTLNPGQCSSEAI